VATFAHNLTEIVVKAHFPNASSVEEQIVTNGKGVLTMGERDGRVHYYLRLESGTTVYKPRLGDSVTVVAKDQDNRTIVVGPLECVDDGTPARFRTPHPVPAST
jgi:hypothetical protein